MKLLIVRHAESQGNATGNYSTAVSDSLSSEGEKQAAALAERLTSWTFEKIIVSPRERAVQTITPYLVKTDQRGEIWPEIAEACWHDDREEPTASWNPQPTDAIPNCSFRDDNMVKPSHPESFGEGLRRVHDALDLLTKMATGEHSTVLMVMHGHVIRELLNLMLNTPEIVSYHQGNCAGTLMTFTDCWTMEYTDKNL